MRLFVSFTFVFYFLPLVILIEIDKRIKRGKNKEVTV